jgi:hypothetical protein
MPPRKGTASRRPRSHTPRPVARPSRNEAPSGRPNRMFAGRPWLPYESGVPGRRQRLGRLERQGGLAVSGLELAVARAEETRPQVAVVAGAVLGHRTFVDHGRTICSGSQPGREPNGTQPSASHPVTNERMRSARPVPIFNRRRRSSLPPPLPRPRPSPVPRTPCRGGSRTGSSPTSHLASSRPSRQVRPSRKAHLEQSIRGHRGRTGRRSSPPEARDPVGVGNPDSITPRRRGTRG